MIPATPMKHRRKNRNKAEIFLSNHAFTFLLAIVYLNVTVILGILGAKDELEHTKVPVMRYAIATARALGMMLNLHCGIIILLACKHYLTLLRRTKLYLVFNFDKAFPKWHMIFGISIFIISFLHAFFHLAWIVKWNGWQGGLWGVTMCVVTGALLLCLLIGIALLGKKKLRHQHFKYTYRIHVVSSICFYCLLVFHGMLRGNPYTWKWLLVPVGVYLSDKLFRTVRTSRKILCTSPVFRVYSEVVSVTLPVDFPFKSGQYAELQVPEIDSSFHPFTIASAPQDAYFRFYIRAAGPWTKQFRKLVTERLAYSASPSSTILEMRYRGPYGAPAEHFDCYRKVVLISGGVGATPFCSIARSCEMEKTQSAPSSLPSTEGTRFVNRSVTEMLRSVTSPAASKSKGDILDAREDAFRFSELLSVASGARDVGSAQAGYGDLASSNTGYVIEENHGMLLEVADAVEGLDMADEVKESGWGGGEKTATDIRTRHDRLCKRLLVTLHSVRFSVFLLLLLFFRIAVVVYASIFGEVNQKFWYHGMYRHQSWGLANLGASIFILSSLIVTIVTEITYLGVHRYSRSFARRLDLLFLAPLGLLLVALDVLDILGARAWGVNACLLLVFFIFPALAALLAHRLYRLVGNRVLFADRGGDAGKTESIDFIWTTPTVDGDQWLLDELVSIGSDFVSLHRYVTRETGSVEAGGGGGGALRTTFGARPDFDKIFADIARKSRSRSKIGVLFCGPPAMGDAVKASLFNAQAVSNLRRIFLHTKAGERVGADERRKMARYGCDLSFCLRCENF